MKNGENATGFVTSGYMYKGDTPQGEGAKLNVMPPGEKIDDQPFARIYDMPLKQVTKTSYPGDGW